MAIYQTSTVTTEAAQVERLVAASVANERERRVRTRIVECAMGVVVHGAHYLRGCFGALPNNADTIRRRHVDYVSLGGWNELALHAASFQYRAHRYRCLGRPNNPNVAGGGALLPAHHGQLRRHLQSQPGPNPRTWQPFRGLWPRRILPVPYNYPDCVARPLRDRIFLGEECLTKMHFDCTGFLNWVLTEVGGSNTTYSIENIRGGSLGTMSPVHGSLSAGNLVPGDLLVKGEGHIAIVGVNGHVIDAFGEDNGVVCRDHDHRRQPYWTGYVPLSRFAIRRFDNAAYARPSPAPTAQPP